MKIIKLAVKPRYFGEMSPENISHDYIPSFDYEEEVRPKRKMMNAFIQAAKDIEARYMQEFKGCFTRFRISFVTYAHGGLAQFANGTGQDPVILIDLKECVKFQKELKNDFTMYQVAITTIMHELKHAKQETEGMDAEMTPEEMEDDAEQFGMRFM